METGWIAVFERELRSLTELKKTERLWHIPFLAGLCVGLPLLISYLLNRMDYGLLSSTGGLVILYLPSSALANRMLTLMACSFGFIVAYTAGVAFSFNPFVSALALGLIALGVHWVVRYFSMKPPANFFFIMLASIASCTPFDLDSIPAKVGLIAMGTLLACVLALLYSLFMNRKQLPITEIISVRQKGYGKLVESVIVGIFMAGSLLVGYLLEMENPYWVPISCAAVMQGVSARHVWQRSLQRILGTFAGLGLAWILLQAGLSPLGIVISISALQFVVEMLVVRQYGLAVIFITPLTLFLAEAGSGLSADPNALISTRFLDIVLGSLVGAVGGWFLHHEQLRQKAIRQIRKTRVAIFRN